LYEKQFNIVDSTVVENKLPGVNLLNANDRTENTLWFNRWQH